MTPSWRGHRLPLGGAWVQPWRWRWHGFERWHRLALGPLAMSIYPSRQRARWFVDHSWQYRRDGYMRHVPTLRRWCRSVWRVRHR